MNFVVAAAFFATHFHTSSASENERSWGWGGGGKPTNKPTRRPTPNEQHMDLGQQPMEQ